MTEKNLCIALNQVGKTVDTPEGKLDILDNISLEVEYQEAVVIKGASGSGKTTLLGLMAGLDQASSGDIKLLGHDLMHKSEEQRAAIRAGQVGFVFQSFHLVQGATALQNVMLPLELSGIENARQLALTSLQQVGLASRVDTLVEHLLPGRLTDLRESTRKELNATTLLSLPLETFSIKSSNGPPDDARRDVDTPIWAGVIPLELTAGEPEPAPDMVADIPLPGYLKQQ